MRGIVKRTALLLLMLAGIQTASADYFAGGTGTPEDPYKISNATQLRAFGRMRKDHSTEWTSTYKSASYILTTNINMSSVTDYYPAGQIGDGGISEFPGTFDGNNKTISNLNVDANLYAGLVGNLSGTIKNLTLSSCTFKSTYGSVRAGTFASTLEANGSIQNCTAIDCTVDALHESLSVSAGGIVGKINSGTNNSITGCWVKGNTSINCNYNSANKLGAIAGSGGTSGTTWSNNYYEWTIKKNGDYVRNDGNWGNGSMNDVEGQFQVEPVTTWAILKSAFTVGGTVKLKANCTDPTKNSASYLMVSSGKIVTLDLNGFTINRGLTSETTNGFVIKNEGNLTITDTSDGGNGRITGGYYANGDAAGVINSGNGNLTIKGGIISGNHGVGVSNSSTTFYIHGGTITANTSGGVNSSYAFNISGKINITGNTNYNVHLDVSNHRNIRLDLDGALDNTTRIGVTLDGAPECFTSGLTNKGGTIDNFISDNNSYAVGLHLTEAYIKRKINPSISMANWVYDGTCHTPTITGVTGSGTQTFSYKLSTASEFSSTKSIDIGTYKVKVVINESRYDMGGEATSGNYTISKRPITITAKDQEITYGNAIATGTSQATVTGGLGSYDNLSSITVAKTDESNVNVGTYNTGITVSNATIRNATKTNNYTITYATGKLTINQKDLTVTADNKNITYGDAVPTYTVSYDGFIDGEGAGNLTATASYACDYQQYSNVGDYTITPSGLMANNYAITFVPGTLTVAPKGVVVTGITASDKVYDGTTTATINSAATFTGKLENDELTLTATGTFDSKDVGTGKTVTVSDHALGGASAGNYTITSTETSTTANITPKTVGISWGPTILTFNNTAQAPTATATELVAGDDCNVTVTGQQTAVGVYSGANVATANALDNGNYQLPNPKPTTAFEIANPLSMSFAAGQLWATWFGAYNYQVPTGMTAYKVSSVSGTTVTVDAIDYVPANTGVLINRTATEAANVSSNIYNGVTGDNTSLLVNGNPTPYTDYILFNDQFVLSSVSTIGEHRCYLPGSGVVAGTRGLNIVVGGDDTTDIEQKLIDVIETGEWYDMQGRRIVRPHKKGIYIRDGKKVVIK